MVLRPKAVPPPKAPGPAPGVPLENPRLSRRDLHAPSPSAPPGALSVSPRERPITPLGNPHPSSFPLGDLRAVDPCELISPSGSQSPFSALAIPGSHSSLALRDPDPTSFPWGAPFPPVGRAEPEVPTVRLQPLRRARLPLAQAPRQPLPRARLPAVQAPDAQSPISGSRARAHASAGQSRAAKA